MEFDNNFKQIIESLKKSDKVDAVVLGGSRVCGNNDELSDYDIYVYCTEILSEEERKTALLKYCSQAEICNHYWESEDNCVMNNGISVDIIYRNFEMISQYLKAVVENSMPFNGYTTCFWHNIITGKVLFDKSGKFSEIQKKYDIPYPEELRKNIIENNRKLLNGYLPSYDKQIKKAADRGDFVSVHHRITEFLSSYFDIIFALNKVKHPGEKRIVQLCKKYCSLLPENFEENINKLLSSVTTGNPYEIVCEIVRSLDVLLEDNK